MSVTKSIALPSRLLEDISMEDLQKLLDEDDKFCVYFDSLELDEIKKIHTDRDKISRTNRELALESLDLKPVYEEKKAKLVETNLGASELNEQYNQKYQKLKTFIKELDQRALLKELRDLAKESEKEADEMTEKFLDSSSGMDPETFIKNFVEVRCTYWKRKVKADKMDEMIKHGLIGSTAPYPHSRSDPSFPVAGSQPPYPNQPPTQSTSPNGPAPYQPDTRRSLPASSNQYQAQNPPPYSSIQPSNPYPRSAPYPTGGPSQPMPPYSRSPGYPTQNTGYPSASRPPPTRGYSPQNSYRPPPVGQSLPYGYPYQQPPPPRRY